MTPKEMWIFKGIVWLGILMALVIVALVIFGFVYQKDPIDNAYIGVVQPTEALVPELSVSEEEELLSAFKQKVAPVEVGPVHRAVEQSLIGAFLEGQRVSNEDFERFLRPLLTAYFDQWYKEMAALVFEERYLDLDEDVMSMMLSSVGTEDKIHFMLLYEKVFLKSRGIVIEDLK
jgi:hypothetical protein